jgi:anthranilate phosphoribosyltransferase
MEVTELLNKLIERKDLTQEETKTFLTEVINDNVLPTQIAAVLIALRMKEETTSEIVGFIQAMREHMIRVDFPDAIDVCGTGGDGSNSINISTAVSFVVAACGIPVAKHGNRAASSKSGAADVLEALGVNITMTQQQASLVAKKVGMVFLFAPLFHPATKSVAAVRKEIKIRTVFNFLGPFLNPASVTRQLLGVPNKEIAEKLLLVGKELEYKHLIIVTSEDGMDEVSLSAKTQFFTLKNKRTKQFVIDPKNYGFKRAAKSEIIGGTAAENAKFLKEILSGKKDAKRDIVVLNSAVALVVADKVSTIEEGIQLAEKAIDTGAAVTILENLIKETQKYA